MTREDFERLLDKTADQLNREVRESTKYHKPDDFQKRVLEVMQSIAKSEQLKVEPSFHIHGFPDIHANGFGVEVKSTNKDSWLSVGNSIFEGMRDARVTQVYVMFGKMGGMPAVKWGRYEDCITHVRISHAPRFVLEMEPESAASSASLFSKLKVAYEEFAKLGPEEKMKYVRDYSRGRLKPGERLWWLEDENSQGVELEVRLYMRLDAKQKIKLRAEGAILFPGIVAGGRVQDKYNDIAFFFLKHRNVFCPQTRDLYSAGSVAGKERGGNYLQRALKKIEAAMKDAAANLQDHLFEEYWGATVPKDQRIKEWLRRADGFARDWKPSETLFLDTGYTEKKGLF